MQLVVDGPRSIQPWLYSDLLCSKTRCPGATLVIRQFRRSGFNHFRDRRVQTERGQYGCQRSLWVISKRLIGDAYRPDLLLDKPVRPRCIVPLELRHLR